MGSNEMRLTPTLICRDAAIEEYTSSKRRPAPDKDSGRSRYVMPAWELSPQSVSTTNNKLTKKKKNLVIAIRAGAQGRKTTTRIVGSKSKKKCGLKARIAEPVFNWGNCTKIACMISREIWLLRGPANIL